MVEALAATSLVAAALLGFSAYSVSLTQAAKLADSASVATALAQQKLEQLRSLPLGAPALDAGDYADGTTLAADGSAGGPFTRTWTVSGGDEPRFGLKTVTVRVAWTDSRPHVTQLSAYVRCSTVPCP